MTTTASTPSQPIAADSLPPSSLPPTGHSVTANTAHRACCIPPDPSVLASTLPTAPSHARLAALPANPTPSSAELLHSCLTTQHTSCTCRRPRFSRRRRTRRLSSRDLHHLPQRPTHLPCDAAPTMQTRRKSLNLGDLGVIAPKRYRTQSHPSPPETVVEGDEPPVKKSKRSHASLSPPPTLMSPPQTTVIRLKEEKPKPKPKPAAAAAELSPPPSPVPEGSSKIDTEGINDDIVVATIQQLERTGNRPHLVKELAAILATKLHAIEKSANPSALISSRLTAYLHRQWPAISPCPLAKDLSPVHPRRLYFYLTTTPHQPIPEVAEPVPKANRIISPSLSSASAADEEDRYLRQRQALSPSPEVDLSSPELDEDHGDAPPTPGGSFSGRNSTSREPTTYSHPRRAASPPLENEERDFKQTASALYEEAQKRRNSQQSQEDVNMDRDVAGGAEQDAQSVTMSIEGDETEECAALKNSEAAVALFAADHLKIPTSHNMDFSSPVLQPQDDLRVDTTTEMKPGEHSIIEHREVMLTDKDQYIALPEPAFAWDSLQSPESIEMDELEDMFDEY